MVPPGLGVYVHDMGQFVQFLLVLLLFISPVFYPLSSLPPVMQPYLYLNPLTIPVEMVRAILFDAPYPTLGVFSVYCVASLLVCSSGFPLVPSGSGRFCRCPLRPFPRARR